MSSVITINTLAQFLRSRKTDFFSPQQLLTSASAMKKCYDIYETPLDM